MVEILVGPKEHRMNVDKAIICRRSSFFRAAFTSPFREGKSSRMKLPEEEPRIVQFVIHWLYMGAKENLFPDSNSLLFGEALKVYLLAAKWILPDLQRGSFRQLTSRVNALQNLSQYREAWNIVQDSKIRFLVVTRYVALLDEAVPTPGTESLSQQLEDDSGFLKDAFICRSICSKLGSSPLYLDNLESFLQRWKD
ncbi:hypothetical protein MMC10_002821 [Thelotrema lepadinum]|nr:hypothetical protein [Thelotrema lepadinum]